MGLLPDSPEYPLTQKNMSSFTMPPRPVRSSGEGLEPADIAGIARLAWAVPPPPRSRPGERSISCVAPVTPSILERDLLSIDHFPRVYRREALIGLEVQVVGHVDRFRLGRSAAVDGLAAHAIDDVAAVEVGI